MDAWIAVMWWMILTPVVLVKILLLPFRAAWYHADDVISDLMDSIQEGREEYRRVLKEGK